MAANSAKRAEALTAELTTFVGRRREVTEVKQLLETSRLATLTGLGGVGKTRLALRVARDARRAFADGVYIAELAALSDPALLAHHIIDALEITDHTTRPPAQVLTDHLRDRQTLLVLDNCEHLLEAIADLVDTLLRAAPGLRILATSRQSLSADGEYVYPVSTLPVPDPDLPLSPGLSREFPSLALFADRAAAVVPGFQITPENQADVVRLCHRLEGIPLAIELAAVRLRVLSVADLADRLDDRFRLLTRGSRNAPERHQTLEATIDYSYSLCSTVEQALWARVSVFSSGFGLDAAEAICADNRLPRAEVLDTVSALTEKSIFIREEHDGVLRFSMLETIREYGHARLQLAGELGTMRKRHRDWYRDLIERVCTEWFGPRQGIWAQTLQREHANLRTALDYCLSEPGEIAVGLRMAGRPWFLWLACGFMTEGQFWLQRALQLSSEPTRERAFALATAAQVAALRGDEAAAAGYLDECLQLGHDLGEREVVAYATHLKGLRGFLSADLRGAIHHYHEGLALYADSGLPQDYPDGLRIQLALTHVLLDEVEEAWLIYQDVFERCERAGETWLRSYAVNGRGFIELTRGQLDQAEGDLRAALKIKRLFQDTLGVAFVLDVLGWASIAKGRTELGLVLVGAASHVWDTFGAQLFGSEQMMARRRHFTDMARSTLGEKASEAALARGAAMTLDDVLDEALGENAKQPPPRWTRVPGGSSNLTRRESEIAELVAKGLSNREIAAALVISMRTAEAHVEHILSKLGFTSRAQIATWVTEHRAGV
jgi:predicted ATPase/DNA-binding CsgD family transcriptional regulator